MTPASLRGLDLSLDYRTSHGRLVDAFYIPCLRVSRTYLRAAGYFTSGSLALVAAGLPEFLAQDGHVRLVASPQLTEEDLRALEAGFEARDDIVARALLRRFDLAAASEIERERLGFLAWMIAEERLDMRIAAPLSSANGIYHEKFGVFIDHQRDAIAFTGSPNETAGGLAVNFESIDVFRGWVPGESERVSRKIEAFEQLWQDRTSGLKTVPLPEAVKLELVRLAPRTRPSRDPLARTQVEDPSANIEPLPVGRLTLPDGLLLRRYQDDAREAWEANSRRGILNMATGTGKTITALAAITQALQSRPGLLVVAVPFIHLADQWAEQMRLFNVDPILCYGSSSRWAPQLREEVDRVRFGLIEHAACVVTHASLPSEVLHDALGRIGPGATRVLVGDEVHHLGSRVHASWQAIADFEHVLGLSATPERWMDPAGNDQIEELFGPVVFEFPLRQAIDEGYLTPYKYRPIPVELTDEETSTYAALTRTIGRAIAAGADFGEIGGLLRRRADILNAAENKVDITVQLFRTGDISSRVLVYTTPKRLSELVLRLAAESHHRVHRFTFREDAAQRQRLLDQFSKGTLDVLVAIRCLDEGVDVPAVRRAIITASSSNPREFIQRRGRILRRAPGKTTAVIEDLIAVPTEALFGSGDWEVERRIMKREFLRFAEFADQATNSIEARAALLPLQDHYHLLDI